MPRTVRFNYGICINRDKDGNGKPCPLCESKELQKVMIGHDFVCAECGEPLHKVQPPKSFWDKYGKLIIILGVLAVLGAIAAVVMSLTAKGTEPVPETPPVVEDTTAVVTDTTSIVPDTVAIDEPTPVTEPAKSTEAADEARSTSGQRTKPTGTSRYSKDLGYATWSGRLKNGLPNDESGTMTFKETHLIDSRDPQKRQAEPGDYVIGEYSEGKLVQGIWYDKSNNVKGSIIIGK